MTRHLWRILLFLAALVGSIALFSCCSPQKRLNKLLTRHPELADTVYKTVRVDLPAYHYDTTIHYSQDTAGIAQLLHAYRDKLDSAGRARLATDFRQYIITRPCITAPVVVPIEGGGKCTITPTPGGFVATVSVPPRKVAVTVPAVQFVYQGRSWRELALAFLAGWASLTLIALLWKWKGGSNG